MYNASRRSVIVGVNANEHGGSSRATIMSLTSHRSLLVFTGNAITLYQIANCIRCDDIPGLKNLLEKRRDENCQSIRFLTCVLESDLIRTARGAVCTASEFAPATQECLFL